MSESTPTPAPPPPNVGWVYFIEGGGLIKIGWSPKPNKRLKALAVGNGHPLTVIAKFRGTVKDEKLLHRLFKAHKSRHDGEWFYARKPILALVDWAKRHGATDLAQEADARALAAESRAAKAEQSAQGWRSSCEQWRRAAQSAQHEASRGLLAAIDCAHRGLHHGNVALQEAINDLKAEIERAIDATDDHQSLADVLREAGRDFERNVYEAGHHLGHAHDALCRHATDKDHGS
jgi:hypothetical protein